MGDKRGIVGRLVKLALAFLLLLLFFLVCFLALQRRTAGKAIAARERIEAAFPTQASYTPPLPDPIAAERLERFLAVRADLAHYCPLMTELSDSFSSVDAHMSELDDSEQPPEAGKLAEGLGKIGSALRSGYNAATRLNAYGVDRNEALLRYEMGLGEFTFINVVACFAAQDRVPGGFLGSREGARVYDGRVAGQLKEMVGRHVTLLEEALASATGPERALLSARLDRWRAEHDALTGEPARLLFADGLPVELARPLEPFGEQLTELCCPATSELDLARTVPSGGIWYDHR